MKSPDASSSRSKHCPRCGVSVAWTGNAHRPFCSLTCRLVDLGVWLDERYRIPDPGPLDESGSEEAAPNRS